MAQDKPKILITNDDGIDAEGLWHLWHGLKDIAKLFIVAPATQKSGVGVGLTLNRPITIHPVPWDEMTPAWKVTGTPADCVRFGLRLVLNEKPDLIVSGINQGSNSGRNVLYSGTVGGVIEGVLRKIPGIAFSDTEFENPRYDKIEPYLAPIVQHILEHPLSKGTLLNVNFPTQFETFKGLKLAKQGKGLWIEDPDHRVNPSGEAYFWHGGIWSHHDEEEDSDVSLLQNGYITAVPIHADELTDHGFFKHRKDHFDSHFEQNSPLKIK